MRRYLLPIAVAVFAAVVFTSCDKNNDDDNKTEDSYKISGTASGANERPDPVISTTATGTLTGKYNTESKMLDYTITWTGLTAAASAMHFHGPASTEEAAGVQVAIAGFPQEMSGTVSGMATLTPEQETQLLGGKLYYNIHTANNPGGEIRGQVTATAD